jgi:subtilisin-like proprotein convertase family protein
MFEKVSPRASFVLALVAATGLSLPAAAQTNTFGYDLLSAGPLDYVVPPATEVPLPGANGAMVDDEVVAVTLPWAFPYYGVDYTTIYVADNGAIRMDLGDVTYLNGCLPTIGFFSFDGPDIAVYWTDLNIAAGGGIYAWEDVAGSRFIISWENIAVFGAATPSDGGTFQIHIDPTGNIEAHYLDLDFDGGGVSSNAASTTIGIQDQVGATAFIANDPLQYSCNTTQGALEGSSVDWTLCDDADDDGFADIACGGADCDDSSPSIYPGALEICDNGLDEDCDTLDLLGDTDNDGYDSVGCIGGTDCDDTDFAINPGVNVDGDAFDACADCDDSDSAIFPGAPEICDDSVDDDCDGIDPVGDVDNDGFDSTICVGGTDCDDDDPAVNPSATEVCDTIDNDCDGSVDFPDGDNDTFAFCDDCDDTDPLIYPGAPESCDTTDSDCDGLVDGQDADAATSSGPGVAITGDGASVPLPVGWGATAESELVVTVLGDSIDDLNITLDIDVIINFEVGVTLVSPAGTSVLLFDIIGAVGADFIDTTLDDEATAAITTGTSPFTGSYSPDSSLSAFDGEDPNGIWTLELTEPSGIGGTLLGWNLTIELDTADADSDGWIDSCGDCDATDATINPGAVEICGDGIDQDCEGGDLLQDADNDTFQDAACGGPDCDDGDASINPSVDVDGDTFNACEDCDDTDATVNPLAVEVCNDGVDNDCDGSDDGEDDDGDGSIDVACGGDDCDDTDPAIRPGIDADGDGFDSCVDCEDEDPDVNPGAIEDCDGIDNDCSGAIDDRDLDGDGFESLLCGVGDDCSDTDPNSYPGAVEVCGDGVDQDCDGEDIDDDADGDGFTALECGGDDCDDGNPNVNPDAAEICSDGEDQDCDGLDEGEDDDGDGFVDTACGGDDCIDTDPDVRPDIDLDGDGADMCVDCDDNDPLRLPGAVELCDGVDNDCDESIDENIFRDRDGDGFDRADCGGPDCDDGDPLIHPDAIELCGDELDNDCNGDLDFDDEACTSTGCGSSLAASRAPPESLLLLLLIPALRRRFHAVPETTR